MPGFSDGVENAVLDAVLRATPYPIAAATRLSLHDHDPGDTGINEIAGLGYIRQAASWAPAAGGIAALGADAIWAGLPACEIAWFGLWTAGGVYVGSWLMGFQRWFTADAISDTLTAPAHYLADNVAVRVTAPPHGALPLALDVLTTYYVVDSEADTFALATTMGGAAIGLGTDGVGYVRPIRRLEAGDGLVLSAGATTFQLE